MCGLSHRFPGLLKTANNNRGSDKLELAGIKQFTKDMPNSSGSGNNKSEIRTGYFRRCDRGQWRSVSWNTAGTSRCELMPSPGGKTPMRTRRVPSHSCIAHLHFGRVLNRGCSHSRRSNVMLSSDDIPSARDQSGHGLVENSSPPT